ncbi:Meiotically up-regulated gene 157 protein [Listeria monocytogenes N53-1]|nr:Meiotically up-regulated gene 157 protein [Listeria monocytogenes]CCQ24692.1 Meiotically up-regulated gene 157 protein [Listeria monocytogenes N53-1]
MDDANVPSLLAAKNDPAYQATRKLILSRENPYFVEGSVLTGIGSPHTPDHYVWPIALSIEGLTAETEAEKQAILEMLIAMAERIICTKVSTPRIQLNSRATGLLGRMRCLVNLF